VCHFFFASPFLSGVTQEVFKTRHLDTHEALIGRQVPCQSRQINAAVLFAVIFQPVTDLKIKSLNNHKPTGQIHTLSSSRNL
jgi:hypothetical protein